MLAVHVERSRSLQAQPAAVDRQEAVSGLRRNGGGICWPNGLRTALPQEKTRVRGVYKVIATALRVTTAPSEM